MHTFKREIIVVRNSKFFRDLSKGQFISKRLFGVMNSSKKNEQKKIRTEVSYSNRVILKTKVVYMFVCFKGRIEHPLPDQSNPYLQSSLMY